MKKIMFTVLVAMVTINVARAQNFYEIYGLSNQSSSPNNGYFYGTTNSELRYQQGYTKSNGTYVHGHYKTNSNSTNYDNFSTQGNYNPYTGRTGTARDYSSNSYNYGSGQTIHTGPRGGQYYFNSRGNKVYVPKR